MNVINLNDINYQENKNLGDHSEKNIKANKKKYFAKLIYDVLAGADDSPDSRELAIETLTNAFEKFIKCAIEEEKNKILLEVKKEIMEGMENYVKNIRSATNHDRKFLNDVSFMIDMIQKINETKNIAQGSHAITKDTNEKSEMIIEEMEKFENMMEKKLNEIELLIRHLKKDEFLTTMDRQILNFIKENGIVCAEDVQRAFKYKGKNAASARLNILYRKNYLEKIIHNKKVYYKIKQSQEI